MTRLKSLLDSTVFVYLSLSLSLLLVACGGSSSPAKEDPPPAAPPPAPGALNTARFAGHTVTRLQNGSVLIAGGLVGDVSDAKATATSELFDPATGKVAAVGAMVQARRWHTATLLVDGRVLITGGTPWDSQSTVVAWSSAEIYDPATRKFQTTGSPMAVERHSHTASLLKNGKVLILGGQGKEAVTRMAELFDPVTGTFQTLTNFMVYGRANHSATVLDSGRVLIAAGTDFQNPGIPLSSEIFEPDTASFRPLAATLPAANRAPMAFKLPSGKVLITGTLGSALFEPVSETYTAQPGPVTPRNYAAVISLNDQSVLLAGGESWADGLRLNSVETYTELQGFKQMSPLSAARWYPAAAQLNDGRIIVIGGIDQSDRLVAAIEVVAK